MLQIALRVSISLFDFACTASKAAPLQQSHLRRIRHRSSYLGFFPIA